MKKALFVGILALSSIGMFSTTTASDTNRQKVFVTCYSGGQEGQRVDCVNYDTKTCYVGWNCRLWRF